MSPMGSLPERESADTKEIHRTHSPNTDDESLLESDYFSSDAFENPSLVNSKSTPCFRVDENEMSITKTLGRKYSVMSFRPSESKSSKIDIIVTQGFLKPTIQTNIFIPCEKNWHSAEEELKPPWCAKLCLSFLVLFVVAMMVTVVVCISTHAMNHGDPNMTVDPQVKNNETEILRTQVYTASNTTLSLPTAEKTESPVIQLPG